MGLLRGLLSCAWPSAAGFLLSPAGPRRAFFVSRSVWLSTSPPPCLLGLSSAAGDGFRSGTANEGAQMCSSKIDKETGRCVITAPSASCRVGEVFYVIGSAAEFAIERADWLLRLLHPPE